MYTKKKFSHILVVVPARLQSTRLPRKPLLDLKGKPLIVRVVENLKPLRDQGAKIIVATDSQEILAACAANQIDAELTLESHQSGSDRCFEVSERYTEYPWILNVQGDEPFLSIKALENLWELTAQSSKTFDLATLAVARTDAKDFLNPNIVKVVTDANNYALYFSRAPIPFNRNAEKSPPSFLHHQGIYLFRREALRRYCGLPICESEQREALEQLRALHHQMKILVVPSPHVSIGVDTPEDLEAARARFQ